VDRRMRHEEGAECIMEALFHVLSWSVPVEMKLS
jgi:hypothetical protein